MDEELDSSLTLWKYTNLKLMQLGNEQGLIHGTFIAESSVEQIKACLVSDYRGRDSMSQMSQLQLMGYFSAVL